MEKFIKVDRELFVDLYSLENNKYIWELSPYYKQDPICAMLKGIVNIQYKNSDFDSFVEYKKEISKKNYYETLVGFGQKHIFIAYIVFDDNKMQYVCKYFFSIQTNQFKKIKVDKTKEGIKIDFYKNYNNIISFIFEDKGKSTYQKDVLEKIKILCEKQVFIKK